MDVMLSMDDMNCARYEARMTPLLHDAEQTLTQTMVSSYSDIWTQMLTQQVSGPEMCSYLSWAYYSRVALSGDMDTYTEIYNTACKDYNNSVTQANISVNWSDDGMISHSFLTKLNDIMKQADSREANTLAHQVVFYNFQTLTSDILSTIALATSNTPTMPTDMQALPASSSIVFEVSKDGTIRGLLNDEEFDLAGCTAGTPCQRSDFEAHLTTQTSSIQNITDYCTQTEYLA